MKKKQVYIAGPMRGIEFYNFPAFDKAASRLRSAGFDPISPADMDRATGFEAMALPPTTDWSAIPEDFSFEDCVSRDIAAVRNSEAIYMLKGWENSKGAKAELALAEWIGLEVLYEGDEI